MRYNASAINSILNNRRTKGENKYMLEEVYFSALCGNMYNVDDNGNITINPQRAYFQDGEYHYQFPDFWWRSTCNNKAIGLRSIKLLPDSVYFKMILAIARRTKVGEEWGEWDQIWSATGIQRFEPKRTIMNIMSGLAYTANHAMEKNDELKGLGLQLIWNYNWQDSSAYFMLDYGEIENTQYAMSFIIDEKTEAESQCGFCEVFNTSVEKVAEYSQRFDFKNVWNRVTLFAHASFVSGTSFQVLGQNDEFYPKPSKMYSYTGNSPDFHFMLSYDGIHTIRGNKKPANFVIQLAYIYNDSDYMAE